MNVTKPPTLKAGDKVGLICPASRPSSASAVARCAWLLEQVGFLPVLGQHVLKSEGFFAGSDQDRLADLMWFVSNPEIKAIYCLCGGYGSLRLLDKIDYRCIKDNPKLIIGSDENSNLLLSINKMAGLITMLGPPLESVQSLEKMRLLQRAITGDALKPLLVNEANQQESERADGDLAHGFVYAPVGGIAQGRLLASNLTALISIMGTPFEPEFQDTILLLDDNDERSDFLERWFTALYVAGALHKVSAVGFGRFEKCHSRGLSNALSWEDLFTDRLIALNIASCFNFTFGQADSYQLVPIGVQSRLDAKTGRIDFLEAALT